jgi:hypothetical protein
MNTPLTDMLCQAKDLIQEVIDNYPAEADGRSMLEEAISLIGRSEIEVE